MRIPFTLWIATVLLCAGCLLSCVQQPVDETGGSTQGPVSDPTLPPDPGAAGRTTVAGIDSDGDGVRDDVQIQIHSSYTGTAPRAGATQLAKALQSLLASGSEKTSALAAAVSLNRAIDCMYALDSVGFGDHVDEIEGLVVNTEARARAYAKAGAFLSGGTYSVSTVADNGSSCGAAP